MNWFYEGEVYDFESEEYFVVASELTLEECLETYKDWDNECPKYKPAYNTPTNHKAESL